MNEPHFTHASLSARALRAAAWARVPLLLAVLMLAALTVTRQPAFAQAPSARSASERSVKAAFLYKFTSYVEWPDSESAGSAPLVIGVLSGGDFVRELTEITAGRLVGSRPIRIRRLDERDSLEGLDVLFIGGDDRPDVARVLSAAAQKPILTVTEAPGAIADGAMINFTVDADRVRFEISLYAAELSRLRLNARLLAVAQQVYKEPE